MVWITNNAAFLDRLTQVRSSMVRVIMLWMNLSIKDYFESTSTPIVSAGNRIYEAGRKSYPGSKCL